MENRTIRDKDITASSVYQNNYEWFGPQKARLKENSGYRANASNCSVNPPYWLAIDLRENYVITAIATQGFGHAREWVESFSMMHLDGKDYSEFYDRNGTNEVS